MPDIVSLPKGQHCQDQKRDRGKSPTKTHQPIEHEAVGFEDKELPQHRCDFQRQEPDEICGAVGG